MNFMLLSSLISFCKISSGFVFLTDWQNHHHHICPNFIFHINIKYFLLKFAQLQFGNLSIDLHLWYSMILLLHDTAVCKAAFIYDRITCLLLSAFFSTHNLRLVTYLYYLQIFLYVASVFFFCLLKLMNSDSQSQSQLCYHHNPS